MNKFLYCESLKSENLLQISQATAEWLYSFPEVHKSQVPGPHGDQYFVCWCLLFVGSQCGACFVTLLAPSILWWLLHFWNICAPLLR